MSYDEDVYDYELSDDDKICEEANEQDFDAKEAYLQLKRYVATRQRKSKDATPESDYASESNYGEVNTTSKQPTEDGDNDATSFTYDGEKEEAHNSGAMGEELCVMVAQYDDGKAVAKSSDEEEDEDFLTTTFTWSLRSKPKPAIHATDDGHYDTDAEQANGQVDDIGELELSALQQATPIATKETLCENLNMGVQLPEKDQKMEKLDRCWPWADRAKIIYKQSTCHLVPQKPLGLIEQRIQLLAKRNLLEHINKIQRPH